MDYNGVNVIQGSVLSPDYKRFSLLNEIQPGESVRSP